MGLSQYFTGVILMMYCIIMRMMKGLPKPQNKEEEWYSGIDKDGISIEDTVPVVALSRNKKDK